MGKGRDAAESEWGKGRDGRLSPTDLQKALGALSISGLPYRVQGLRPSISRGLRGSVVPF